jgi:hypothetical protein
MLTIAQKEEVRRHLFFPVIGLPIMSPSSGITLASGAAGYRFFDAYGFLEWKMNNLAPSEEARLAGMAYGAVIINAIPAPAFQSAGQQLYVPAGATATITLSGGPLVSPVIMITTAPVNQTPLQFAAAIAATGGLNATLQAAGFFCIPAYGGGSFAENFIPLPEAAFVNAQTFTITATSTLIGISVTSAGGLLTPSVTIPDPITALATTYNGYVPILNLLEAAFLSTTQNQDTSRADVWKWNPREMEDREKLYKKWQRATGLFMGLPLGTESGTQQWGHAAGVTI